MFTKVCLTLALGVSSALALSVNPLSSVTSGAETTITWTSTSSDPIFSIELLHPSFNNAFAIANNVDPAANTLTLQLPSVPTGDGYTLQFVNVTDINTVYATSGGFSIGAEGSASSSAGSGSGAGGSTTGGAGAGSTTTGNAGSGSGNATASSGAQSTASGSGSANSAGSASGSATPSSTSRSISGSASGSGSGSASGSAPSSSGSGAPSGAVRTVPAGAAALILALAGVAVAL